MSSISAVPTFQVQLTKFSGGEDLVETSTPDHRLQQKNGVEAQEEENAMTPEQRQQIEDNLYQDASSTISESEKDGKEGQEALRKSFEGI